MTDKFCKDCKHHDAHPFFGHHCFSKHRETDPVTGTVHGRKCADGQSRASPTSSKRWALTAASVQKSLQMPWTLLKQARQDAVQARALIGGWLKEPPRVCKKRLLRGPLFAFCLRISENPLPSVVGPKADGFAPP
jgi:hypothetical protein